MVSTSINEAMHGAETYAESLRKLAGWAEFTPGLWYRKPPSTTPLPLDLAVKAQLCEDEGRVGFVTILGGATIQKVIAGAVLRAVSEDADLKRHLARRQKLNRVHVTVNTSGLHDDIGVNPPLGPGLMYAPTYEEIDRLRQAFSNLAIAPLAIIQDVTVRLGRECSIIVSTEVFDRETGEPLGVQFSRGFIQQEVLRRPQGPEHLVRRALHEALTHEADECIRYVSDGSIVFDPHGKERY